VSTELPPLPRDAFTGQTPLTAAPGSDAADVDPDDPSWGVAAALLVWLASILLMIVIPLLALVPYAVYSYRGSDLARLDQVMQRDPNVLLITIAATIPTHLITLAIVWAVVTRLGKRPFWKSLGWGWSRRFGPLLDVILSVAGALLLLGASILVAWLIGGQKTPFQQMLESSAAARFATAFLATATAPLVEELVYRGVLYAALQKALAKAAASYQTLIALAAQGAPPPGGLSGPTWRLVTLVSRAASSLLTFFSTLDARRGGVVWAVIIVGSLFSLVHVTQYYNNLGVIVAVTMLGFALTIVRAVTGRVLPCFIIHLVYNGVQVAILIFEYFRPHTPPGEAQAALFFF
jgi:membrane protease YdiL (CAAX protease family)